MSSVFGKKRKKKQTQPKAVSVMGGQKAEICSPPGTAVRQGAPFSKPVCAGGHAPTGADTAREIGCPIVCELQRSECAIGYPILSRGNPKGCKAVRCLRQIQHGGAGAAVAECKRRHKARRRMRAPQLVHRAVRHRRAARFPSLIIRYNTAPGPATTGGTGPLRRPPAPRGCRSGRWPRRQTPRWHRRTCSWTADG